MRKVLRNMLLLYGAMLISVSSWAQGTIKGVITDGETSDGLIGANVVLKGTTTGTITDIEGKFVLTGVNAGNQTITISYIGYMDQEIDVTVVDGDVTEIGTISLSGDAIGLQEVQVVASVAIDRKTPVAVSTIKSADIEEKLGNQEFPEILKTTPSVYVTKQGGGFGDSRINIRGFDQKNTAVMINGIPVNDMENGWVYWSNWAGLGDVTRSMQVQRGLGASKIAVSSVGGTINIITKTTDIEKGGAASLSIGNNEYSKFGLVLSTGRMNGGWAITVQGNRTAGNGYIEGTKFEGWNYFASIAKELGKNHQLVLTGIGAPQWHHQRSSAFPSSTEDYEEYGNKYNPDWGFLDGEEFSNRKNFYHKPKVFLNHYWNISNKTELASSAYISFGRGGGTGELGSVNGIRIFYSDMQDQNGRIRYDDIKKWNSGGTVSDWGDDKQTWDQGGGFNGQYVNTSSDGIIRRASMNEHNWYGLLSTLNHELTDHLNLMAGVDLRYYKGAHYRRLDDLLGAAAYFDDDDINNPEKYVTDQSEKIDYHNDGLVNWLGGFAQLEYSKNKVSVFVTGALNNTGYKRIDYFNYEDSDPEQSTDWENFLGYSAKTGLNYNITDKHNIFANTGFFSRAPFMENIWPNYTNEKADILENENVFGVEFGYGFRSRFFNANVNVYHTNWINKTSLVGIEVEDEETEEVIFQGDVNVTGQDAIHQGIEIDFYSSPVKNLNINGMLSIGNWRWTNDVTAVIYNNELNTPIDTVDLLTENLKVGDAAQTTAMIGVDYTIKIVKLSLSYHYFDNLYARYDVADRRRLEEGDDDEGTIFDPANRRQAWKLPSYGLVDAGISVSWNVSKTKFTFRANMNNVFDTEYLAEAVDSPTIDAPNIEDNDVVSGFYGFGRTWNIGLKVNF